MRENAKCVNCLAVERHRLMWLYLRERTDLMTRPQRVLHFAPETGIEARLRLIPTLEYQSADLEPGRAMIQADITDTGLPDRSYDAIICSDVLEHVPDDAAALRELLRLLRPNGWAYLRTPIDVNRATTYEDWSITSRAGRLAAFGQEDHVRFYGRDFPARVRSAGFELFEDNYALQLSPALVRRYGLVPQVIYIAHRPG